MRRWLAVAASVFGLIVTSAPAYATFPGENGKLVVNVVERGEYRLVTANPDGTNLQNVSIGMYRAEKPAWSADGTKIVFQGLSTPGEQESLYIAEADGSNRILSGTRTMSPAWSPDGTRIAFRSFSAQVGIMNADGSNRQLLDTPYVYVTTVDWSPDGTKLAFDASAYEETVCDPEFNECYDVYSGPNIYVMSPDGSNLTQLTNCYICNNPSWSPDGTKIVFSNDGLIQVMNADGSGRRAVGGVVGYVPKWSPDGTKIAFALLGDTFVMDTEGQNVTKILDGERRHSFLPHYGYLDWQPIPNNPPDCSNVTVSTSLLWPPNHHLRKVALAGASDPDGDPATIEITGISQDEPVGSKPDATPAPSSESLTLRAERAPNGNGRVYRIDFRASDGKGGSCSGQGLVGVPRYKQRPAVDSAPPSYDSFGG